MAHFKNIEKMEKEKIHAIADEDFENLLIQVGDYDAFVSGEVKCQECGRVINTDNLVMVVPFKENGKIKLKYYCDNIGCAPNL